MASVLVVDDSKSMREMVSFTLRSSGYTVTDACDGGEALRIAKTSRFDVVLTDVNMPVMDGITLVRELREVPAFRFTPILVLTTESSADRKRAGREAGATGWLVKPFNPEQLLATLRRVVR